MQPREISAENKTERRPVISNEHTLNLISQEAFLRRLAYKNTILKTGESFFDDSDMKSDYFLVVVYDKTTHLPLLSSRYYFDKPTIAKCLKGDARSGIETRHALEPLNLNAYKEGELFLADRLSGNIHSPIYRQFRNHIFSVYYNEIIRLNKECKLLLMVRKEPREKLLSGYLRLGFNRISATLHKGKEHWILLLDLKKVQPNA